VPEKAITPASKIHIQMIDRAVALSAKFSAIQKELEGLKDAIKDVARAMPVESRTSTDKGGWSITLAGTWPGDTVRVTESACKLLTSVDEDEASRIRQIVGNWDFARLFDKAEVFTPVEAFRDRVVKVLKEESDRAQVLALMTGKPSVSINFTQARQPAAESLQRAA
jgi:hypothetical protein